MMIYPLLFLLCLASLSEGCAPHSPKRRPPRPQPPVTPKPPITPMMCSQLTLDSTCTDADCKPEKNDKMEIKCSTTGKTQLVIVDSSAVKKPVTEAKCDSASGKWAFKNGNDAVEIAAAKTVFCARECEVAETCACPKLTVDSTCTDAECSPEKNDEMEIKCATTGERNLLMIVDSNAMKNQVTEAKCDSATGEWVFKNGNDAVDVEAAKVFCGKPCLQLASAHQDCPAIFSTVPENCNEPATNTVFALECPALTYMVILGAVDTDYLRLWTDKPVCDTATGKWKIDRDLTFEPTRITCGDTCSFPGIEWECL